MVTLRALIKYPITKYLGLYHTLSTKNPINGYKRYCTYCVCCAIIVLFVGKDRKDFSMRLFVDNVTHTTAKDLEHALQHPSRTSSAVKIVTDEDYFPTSEEVLQHAHQRYLESLDAPEVCYDKYRRLLKVGMSVWVDDVCATIVGIEVIGTAQIPRLRLDHSATLVVPCTVVLCSSTGQLR